MNIGFWCNEIESEAAPERCLRFTMGALDDRDDVRVVHGSRAERDVPFEQVVAPSPAEFAERIDLDVVHWNKMMDRTIPARVDVPTVLTYHGDVHWELPRMNYGERPYLRSVKEAIVEIAKFWQYDAVCFTTDDLKQRMSDRIGPVLPSNRYVTPNAPPPDLESDAGTDVLGEYGIDRPYVFHLSFCGPRKNPEMLLRGYASAEVDHDLVIGGNGWDSKVELIERLGIEEDVHILGYVEEGDLAQLYTNASAFLFPSKHECFGMPPLEAIRCGTTPVVSDAYALPEVVGDAGVYCDPDDRSDIASSIEVAVSAEEDLRSHAEQYSWTKTADKLLEVYNDIT